MRSVLLHEVQHIIQGIEGFAKGGNTLNVRDKVESILENTGYRMDAIARDLQWLSGVEIARDYLREARKLRRRKNAWKYSGLMYMLRSWGESAEETREKIIQDIARRYNEFREQDNMETEYRNMPEAKLPMVYFSDINSIEEGLKSLENAPSRKLANRGEAAKKNRKLAELVRRSEVTRKVLEQFKYEPFELYQRLAGEIEARNVQLRRDWTAAERAARPFNETLEYPGEALVSFSVFSPSEASGLRALQSAVRGKQDAVFRSDTLNADVMLPFGSAGVYKNPDNPKSKIVGAHGLLHIITARMAHGDSLEEATYTAVKAVLAAVNGRIVDDSSSENKKELTLDGYNTWVYLKWRAENKAWVVTGYKENNKHSSVDDRQRAMNLAESYALNTFGGLERVGAALEYSIARAAREYKQNNANPFLKLDFSSSLVSLDEEQLLTPIAAAGQGFKANAAFAEHMEQEMRSSILRMKKLSSKVRTEREDAIAAMGTMIHAAKAIVQYLPEGYRFNVRPYLNKLEVLAEIATTGTISITEDIASKDIKSWLHKQHQEHAQLTLNAAQGGVQVDSTVDEIIKEFGSLKLTLAMERITDRVAAQLRKHAKDQVATKINELIDKLAPKVDPKTGKLKGGKMGADDYRDLAEVSKALAMTADELQAEISATETEMSAPDITEEQHARLENKLVLLTNFGNLDGMTPEEAHAAYDALRARIYAARFAWENTLADRRIARRRMVNKIVEGVGQIGQNEYNARKRTQKTSKRLKTAVDIVKGAPQALASLRGYLPMREMVDNLLARINNAGELLKQWQRERWAALEILSQQTLGKSWRECMDLMHSVNPTGVSFDRPVYKTLDIRVDDLLRLLNMTPRQRHAEMARRKQAGGVEGTRIYSERDLEVAEEAYEKMLAAGHDRATVTERYLDHIEHEDNLKLSRGEALYAILMYEQPTYTERMEAAGYTPEVIDGLKAYIGEDMLQFGYGLRELFAQQGDRIAAIFEREFGVPFPREKNYFAARWNVTAMKDTPAEDLLASMAGTPGSSKGFLKSRVNHNLELDMTKDALQVFLQATTVTDAWMATQDIVADFKAWTRDPRFERALVGLIGRDEYQNLVEWIRLVEQGGAMDSLHMGTAQEAINKLYGSGAVAILGLRIQTLLRQVPSVVNGLLGAADISTAEWLSTLSRMKHGDAPMTYQRMIDSQLTKNRQQARMSTMETQALRTHDQQSSPVESLLTEAMRPMEWMDARLTALSLVPVWNVYYTRATNAGSSHQEAEQIAWEQTAIVANLSAQPIGIFNRSKLMQSRNAIVRAVFYMLSENTAKFGLACSLWKQGKRKAFFRAWLYYGALNAAISALLDCLQGDPEKWERGDAWEYVLSALYGPAAALPLIGEALEALTTGLLRTIGEAADWDALKKARGRASVGKTIVDLGGTIRALTSLVDMLTDDKDHTLAEYTRAVSTVSRSTAIATGWLGNGISYWSSALAVLMNPIDFVARVWRNLKHYSE
jgi:hypothetical protein